MLVQLPAGAAADAAGVADSAGAAGVWIHDVIEGLERPRNDPGTTLKTPKEVVGQEEAPTREIERPTKKHQ